MKELKYPTLEEALYLHDIFIDRFGGAKGVVDLGLIESALVRPRSGYYKTFSEQAAALMHSLVKNHAFVDGNICVAFALTATFLLMNGYNLIVDPDQIEKFVEELVSSNNNKLEQIVDWLEKYMIGINV